MRWWRETRAKAVIASARELTVNVVNRDLMVIWINSLSQLSAGPRAESDFEFETEFYPALNQATVLFVPPRDWRNYSLDMFDRLYLRPAIDELRRVIPVAGLNLAARRDKFEIPQGAIAAAQDGYAGFNGRTVIDWVPVDKAPRNDLTMPKLVNYYNIEYDAKEHRLCHEVMRFDIKRIAEPEGL